MRKKEFVHGLLVFLLYGIVAYGVLGANFFAGERVAPMDVLLARHGWNGSGYSLPPINLYRSDIVDSLLPSWRFVKSQLLQGHIPLWNPNIGGGGIAFPMLPNSYVSIRYLLFCLFDDATGFYLGLLSQMMMTGFGTYLFCRLRVSGGPSFFGGLTYMLCGFNVSWMMWPQGNTSLWIPWVLWSAMRLYESVSIPRFVIAVLCVAAMMFGGFPLMWFYGFVVLSALISATIVKDSGVDLQQSLKKVMLILLACILGVGLTSFQLLPFLKFLGTIDLAYRYHNFRFPVTFNSIFFSPQSIIQRTVETNGYVGFIAMGCALIAVIPAFNKRFLKGPLSPALWAGCLVVTLILMFRSPRFLSELLLSLPVLRSNPHNRFLALFGLELAILSAVGIQILSDWGKVWLARHKLAESRATFVMGLLLGTLIVAHMWDLQRFSRSQNAVVARETYTPKVPLISLIQKKILPGQSVLADSDSFVVSGTLGNYGLAEWFAHTFHTSVQKELLAKIDLDAWKTATAAVPSLRRIKINSPLIDALGMRFVLGPSLPRALDKSWKKPLQSHGIYLFEKKRSPAGAYVIPFEAFRAVPDPAKMSWNEIAVEKADPDEWRFRVLVKTSCWFVRTVNDDPGWTTILNGRVTPTLRYLDVLPAVLLEPGLHVIECRFRPRSWDAGLAISGFFGFVMLGLISMGLTRRIREHARTS